MLEFAISKLAIDFSNLLRKVLSFPSFRNGFRRRSWSLESEPWNRPIERTLDEVRTSTCGREASDSVGTLITIVALGSEGNEKALEDAKLLLVHV